MAVKYKVISRKSLHEVEAPHKYFAVAIGDGTVTMDTLVQEMAGRFGVSEADCYRFIMAYEEIIIRHLSQGQIVKLSNLGTFQISISSVGKDTPKAVTARSIVKSRIIFRPASRMKTLLKRLSFEKVKATA